MIQADVDYFSYDRGAPAIVGLSFRVDAGERVVVSGPSGCGKSTLLRLIAGLLPRRRRPDAFEGRIRIMNRSPIDFRRGGRLAFMFQEPVLFPHMTVLENVSWPLEVTKTSRPADPKEVLERVGLGEEMRWLPDRLSGGMKARVALARSVVTRPSVLLLDEPFAALDVGWRHSLYRQLVELCEEIGCTICMVTHDIRESVRLADRINVLARGSIQREIVVSDRSLRGVADYEQRLEELLLAEHTSMNGGIVL